MSIETILRSEPTTITAYGHILRKYNKEAVLSNIKESRDLLTKEVRLNNPNLTDKEIEEIVDSELASITGNKVEGHDIKTSIKGSHVFEREIAISDDVLLERGLLDYDSVLNHVDEFRQLVVETGLNRVAREEGYKTWDTMLDAYVKKANRSIGKSMRKVPEEAVGEANKEAYKYNLDLLKDTKLLLKGTFSKEGAFKNNQIISWIASRKEYVYAAQAGNMFLSIIPDLASLVLRRNFIQGTKNLGVDALNGMKSFFKSVDKTEGSRVD